ncbi:EAL domain-containing protein [Alkalimarinus coralli]|uniref:sensor domain-containing phosphodiesterase n=1 Tax=Alkalimarinus coralli TaxID=2935863 RepID=UPI00202B1689|nr:EAL domain-containing protein [Alkalimarinus coralli]
MGIELLILFKVGTATLWLFLAFIFFKYFLSAKYHQPVLSTLFLLVVALCFVPIVYTISTHEYSLQLNLPVAIMGVLVTAIVLSPSMRREIRKLLKTGKEAVNHDDSGPVDGLLGSISAHAFEGIYVLDPESMRYLDVNTSGAAALKYNRADMLGMHLKTIHPNDFGMVEQRVRETLQTEKRIKFEVNAMRSDNITIFVEVALKHIHLNGRSVVLAVGRDLTRRQLSQRKINQLNQLYQLLTLSNRAITRIKDRRKLSEKICDLAVGEGGFLLGWIGDLEDRKVLPICHSGVNEGYVENLNIDLDIERYLEGPVVRSINERKVIFINNLSNEKGFQSLKVEALKRGFNSVASVPIFVGQDVCSVLVIYSSQENIFNTKLAQLLTNLSEDLSYAFGNINAERLRLDAEKRLRLLSSVVDQSTDAVTIMNAGGGIEYVNPRFTTLTGYTLDEIKGKSPSVLCSSKGESEKFLKVFNDLNNGRKWKGEFLNRKKGGEEYWSMDTISPIKDDSGAITQYVSTSEDYSALRQAQDKIEQLAFYDSLTGLPNRRLLHDRLIQAISLSAKNYSYVAVLMLDIDKFKTINDSLGHTAGDELIKNISLLLTDYVGHGDTVARLGADEFIVVLSNVRDMKEVVYFAEKLLEKTRQPMDVQGNTVSVTASIGVSLHPMDTVDGGDLLRCADLAMYHAKAEGRNNFQFYTREMNDRALEQLDLEKRLKVAIQDRSFELYYQPQIDMNSGKVKGVEALIRWIDDGQYIPPDKFIPVAEESGLMDQIGEWVIKQAISDAERLNDQFADQINVAINLSASQFRESDKLIELITSQLKETGLKPGNVELELTESMLIGDLESVISTLDAFRALGITLAIDDFGTGYSSLSYLKNLPIDTLKIDRSFIKDIGIDASDAAITVAIITLANELNMSVLAEGVETEGQMLFLEGHGCSAYQGYYYSKPLPLTKLIDLLS